MNVLVTGAAGLLGAHCVASLASGHNVTGIDRHPRWGDVTCRFLEGDLSDPQVRANAIAVSAPAVVIHCAGMVDVDRCERDPERAFGSNATLTRNLAEEIPKDCLLVYISSDSVFHGKSSFWSEGDTPSPINVYARSKLAGEQNAARWTNHLILRTNFYGWSSGRKKTSAEWMYGALANGESATLFDDFFFTPMYVVDLVRYMKILIDGGHRGLFHVAGRQRVSKYTFGETMARVMAVPMNNIVRGSLNSASFIAPRSGDISLSSDRARKATRLELPDCEEGLAQFIRDREKSLAQRF